MRMVKTEKKCRSEKAGSVESEDAFFNPFFQKKITSSSHALICGNFNIRALLVAETMARFPRKRVCELSPSPERANVINGTTERATRTGFEFLNQIDLLRGGPTL